MIRTIADARAISPTYRAFTSTWMGKPVPNLLETSHSAAIALFLSPTNVSGLLAQGYLEMLVNHDKTAAASYYGRAEATDLDSASARSKWRFAITAPWANTMRLSPHSRKPRARIRSIPRKVRVDRDVPRIRSGGGSSCRRRGAAETRLAVTRCGVDCGACVPGCRRPSARPRIA